MQRDGSLSSAGYAPSDLSRADVDALEGAVALDFGTSWCGVCRATAPTIAAAFAAHPEVVHLRIEDGPGRPLGRSYGVKLWPTLIFLRDGTEVQRLVRPRDAATIRDALRRIDAS
jgi:thioredoxin 1